ncbi:MAG: DUF2625 family protein [Phycisphaerales bacterium]|nr:DUF2625 family protein [Phycisphaerales bacterium]
MQRRTLKELTEVDEPAWPEVAAWFDSASVSVQQLGTDANRSAAVLERLQVTLRSALGAQAFLTGGVFLDHKWLRLLGCGSQELPLDIVSLTERLGFWPDTEVPPPAVAVAVDVLGGLFAINGGAFGNEGAGNVFYFSPDQLKWENLNQGHSAFLQLMLAGKIGEFYESLRWEGWEEEAESVGGNQSICVYPPLWAAESRPIEKTKRAIVPLSETLDLHFNVYAPAIASGATQFEIKVRP